MELRYLVCYIKDGKIGTVVIKGTNGIGVRTEIAKQYSFTQITDVDRADKEVLNGIRSCRCLEEYEGREID